MKYWYIVLSFIHYYLFFLNLHIIYHKLPVLVHENISFYFSNVKSLHNFAQIFVQNNKTVPLENDLQNGMTKVWPTNVQNNIKWNTQWEDTHHIQRA